MPRKKYLSDYPLLANEFHPTKNGELTPETVPHRSTKQVFWRCLTHKGHPDWPQKVLNRTMAKNSRCPECVKQEQKYISDYPELEREFLVKENYPLKANEVTHGSGRKVWWKCSKSAHDDHVWQDTPGHRTNSKDPRGCPFCSGQRVCKSNSLAYLHPDVASEWHPTMNGNLSPFDVIPGYKRKVWWMCSKNKKCPAWRIEPFQRTRSAFPNTCQSCKEAGKKYLSDYPDLVSEFHPSLNGGKTPKDFSSGTRKKVWWQCKKFPKHVWSTSVYNRTKEKNPTGCPECTGQSSIAEIRLFTEILSVFKDSKHREKIGKDRIELDIFIPSLNTGIEYDGSYFHSAAKDLKKNKVLEEMAIRLLRIREAPLKKIQSSDILVPADTRDLDKGVINKIFLKLKKTRLPPQALANIDEYLKAPSYQNDSLFRDYISCFPNPHPSESLASLYPDLAKQWDYEKNFPFKPDQFAPNTNQKFHWTCNVGADHKWSASPNSRVGINKTGCPFCAKKRPSSDYNLKTEHPELLSEWDYGRNQLTPEDYLPKSGKIVTWQCKNGHVWEESISNRTLNKNGGACKVCRSLEFKFPKLAEEWHPTKNAPTTPGEVLAGTGKKFWWKCKKGHEWQASPNNRIKNGVITECLQCKREIWDREGWPMHRKRS